MTCRCCVPQNRRWQASEACACRSCWTDVGFVDSVPLIELVAIQVEYIAAEGVRSQKCGAGVDAKMQSVNERKDATDDDDAELGDEGKGARVA